METLALALASVGAAIIAALAAVVIARMVEGKIDLSHLLSDRPETSLSRFQFLVFTFVMGLSYLLLVIYSLAKDCSTASGCTFTLPDVPVGALALLGISGGSYVLGKGIERAQPLTSAQPHGGGAQQGGGASPMPPPAPPPGGARP